MICVGNVGAVVKKLVLDKNGVIVWCTEMRKVALKFVTVENQNNLGFEFHCLIF